MGRKGARGVRGGGTGRVLASELPDHAEVASLVLSSSLQDDAGYGVL